MEQDGLRENFIQELRRGVIILAVLGCLREEQYGYSIMKSLGDQGLEVDQGTLYPLLRRLETQGLLESKWRMEEARPRRYYVISTEGLRLLPQLYFEWEKLSGIVKNIMAAQEAASHGND